jgi:hypothetical protein
MDVLAFVELIELSVVLRQILAMGRQHLPFLTDFL